MTIEYVLKMSSELVEDIDRPDERPQYNFIITNDYGIGCEIESGWQYSNFHEHNLGSISDLCKLIYPNLCIDNPSNFPLDNSCFTYNPLPAYPIGTLSFEQESIITNSTSIGFDGDKDNYIDCSNLTPFSASSPISYSVWFKLTTATNGYYPTIICDNTDWTDGWGLFIEVAGGVNTLYVYNANDEYLLGTEINVNEWYHAAVVIDSDGSGELYVNGERTGTGFTGATFTDSTNHLIIGGDGGFDEESFIGLIDNVCIFDKALTETEITGLYNGSNPSGVGTEELSGEGWDLTENTTAQYKLNDLTGSTTIIDSVNPEIDFNSIFDWNFYIITKDKNGNLSTPSLPAQISPEEIETAVDSCAEINEFETVYVKLLIAPLNSLAVNCDTEEWIENCQAYYSQNIYGDIYDLYNHLDYVYIDEDIWDLLPKPCSIRWNSNVYEVPEIPVERTNWKDEWNENPSENPSISFSTPIILNINPNQCFDYKHYNDSTYDSCVSDCYSTYIDTTCYEQVANDDSIYISDDCYLHLRCNDSANIEIINDSSNKDNHGIAYNYSSEMRGDNPSYDDGGLYFNGLNDYIDCEPLSSASPELEYPYATTGSGDSLTNQNDNPSAPYYFNLEENPSINLDEFEEEFSYYYDHRFFAGESYTYSLWIKIDNNATGTLPIISDGMFSGWSLTYDVTTSTINFYDNTNPSGVLISSTLQSNKWYFITVTIDSDNPSADSLCSLFVNGVNINTVYYYITDTDYHLIIGSDGENYYKGYIDDVRLYKTILSSTTITALYNDGEIDERENLIEYDSEEIDCQEDDEALANYLLCLEDCYDAADESCFDNADCLECIDDSDYYNPSSGYECTDPSSDFDRICVYESSELAWQDFYHPFGYTCEDKIKNEIDIYCDVDDEDRYKFKNEGDTTDFIENFRFNKCESDPQVCLTGQTNVRYTYVAIEFSVFTGSADLYLNNERLSSGQTYYEFKSELMALKSFGACPDNQYATIQVRSISDDADYQVKVYCYCMSFCADDYECWVTRAIPCLQQYWEYLPDEFGVLPEWQCCEENAGNQITTVYVRSQGIPSNGAYFKYNDQCYYVNNDSRLWYRCQQIQNEINRGEDITLLDSVEEDYSNCEHCCCGEDYYCIGNSLTGGYRCSNVRPVGRHDHIIKTYSSQAACESGCDNVIIGEDCSLSGCSSTNTPTYLIATFSGVTALNGCYNSCTYDKKWENVYNINKSFLLTQKTWGSSSCTWEYCGPATGTVTPYTGGTACNGTPSAPTVYVSFKITATLIGGSLNFQSYLYTYSNCTGTAGKAFAKSIVLSNCFDNPVNLTNIWTEDPCSVQSPYFGGTCILSAYNPYRYIF